MTSSDLWRKFFRRFGRRAPSRGCLNTVAQVERLLGGPSPAKSGLRVDLDGFAGSNELTKDTFDVPSLDCQASTSQFCQDLANRARYELASLGAGTTQAEAAAFPSRFE